MDSQRIAGGRLGATKCQPMMERKKARCRNIAPRYCNLVYNTSRPLHHPRRSLSRFQNPDVHKELHRLSCGSTEPPHAILKRCIGPFTNASGIYQAAVGKFTVDEDMLLDHVSSILQCFVLVKCNWHTDYSLLRGRCLWWIQR